MTLRRSANCSCGALQLDVSGDPVSVAVCNCTSCQKRTGSAFGMGAYFKENQIVTIVGQSRIFVDKSDSGKLIERHFCEVCGSTVFWKAEFLPDSIGVAVGCFTDPDFPEPSVSVWNGSKLNWVSFPKNWLCLSKQNLPK